MSLGNVASVIGIVAGLLALVGVLAVAFRTGRSAQIIKNSEAVAASWKERAEAMEKKAAARDEAIKDLQDKLRMRDEEVLKLRANMATLQDLVTGRSAIEQLGREMSDGSKVTEQRMGEVLEQVGTVRTDVRHSYEILTRIERKLAREVDSGEFRQQRS